MYSLGILSAAIPGFSATTVFAGAFVVKNFYSRPSSEPDKGIALHVTAMIHESETTGHVPTHGKLYLNNY